MWMTEWLWNEWYKVLDYIFGKKSLDLFYHQNKYAIYISSDNILKPAKSFDFTLVTIQNALDQGVLGLDTFKTHCIMS